MSALFGAVLGAVLIYVTGQPWGRFSPATARRSPARWPAAAGLVFVVASAGTLAVLARHAADALAFTGLAATGALFLLIALLDLRYQIVPNRIVYPAVLVALVARLVTFGLADALHSLIAGLGAFGLFLLVAWLSPGGLGGGDIKLAGLVGVVVGVPNVLVALPVAVMTGGFTAILLALVGRRDAFPYGPFLCFGALVALIWNPMPRLLMLMQTLGGW